MLTPTLIHLAILAYFLVPSAHGGKIDLDDGKNVVEKVDISKMIGGLGAPTNRLITDLRGAKAEGKVVLRESSLSEKFGLETFIRTDHEIAALQSSATGLGAVVGWVEKAKETTPEKPSYARYSEEMKDKFVMICDGDKGVYFDGKYFPTADRDCFFRWEGSGYMAPVKCVLLTPSKPESDDAHLMRFTPHSHVTIPNDFFDYPESQPLQR